MFLKLRVGNQTEYFQEELISKIIIREKEAVIIGTFDHDSNFETIEDPESVAALKWYLDQSPNAAFDVLHEYALQNKEKVRA